MKNPVGGAVAAIKRWALASFRCKGIGHGNGTAPAKFLTALPTLNDLIV
ncbi:hypothetical protein ACPUER_35350 [Burkholderia sp. DN3021]